MSSEQSSFIRQWNMFHVLLTNPNGKTVQELAKEYQVSVKTIRRDLGVLKTVLVPLCSTNEPHGEKRFYIDSMLMNFSTSLNQEELLAFYIARKMMKPLRGTYFWEGITGGCAKIQRFMNKPAVHYAKRMAPYFLYWENGQADYETCGEMVDLLLRGMEESAVIQITYRSLDAQKEQTYLIHPYHFVIHGGFLYLIGFSCKNRDIRLWKVNRIVKAEWTEKHFRRRKDFNAEEYLSHSLLPFVGGGESVLVTLRLSQSAAVWILEQKLTTVKESRGLDDGSLLVVLDVEPSAAFFRWILGFGHDVEIIEPETVRVAFRHVIERIEEKYEPTFLQVGQRPKRREISNCRNTDDLFSSNEGVKKNNTKEKP